MALENYRAISSQLKSNTSFYTSRTLVNLSGLSVADPQPLSFDDMTKEGIQAQAYHSYGNSRGLLSHLPSHIHIYREFFH